MEPVNPTTEHNSREFTFRSSQEHKLFTQVFDKVLTLLHLSKR